MLQSAAAAAAAAAEYEYEYSSSWTKELPKDSAQAVSSTGIGHPTTRWDTTSGLDHEQGEGVLRP